MTTDGTRQLLVNLIINDRPVELTLEPRVSLLDALREQLDLPGTKKGCDQGGCGACTVLVDGARVLSCLTLAVQCQGRTVTTIEGIGTPSELHPLQQAFVACDGLQCGFCTSGQICSALGMLQEYRAGVPSAVTPDMRPSAFEPDGPIATAEIRERMSGNLCRCGAYNGIVDAIGQYAGRAEEQVEA
ncbi:MAG TPA: 2Fe-2S iron-sulfur cluster-binding protein [Roseiflexaceae bacterium]|nr:2Fe-2S iron-sulfur cluster-binding protein [Roseiflexaceae bacterium]